MNVNHIIKNGRQTHYHYNDICLTVELKQDTKLPIPTNCFHYKMKMKVSGIVRFRTSDKRSSFDLLDLFNRNSVLSLLCNVPFREIIDLI